MNQKKSRMQKLIKILNEASISYYRDDNPTLSDKQYDELYDELESLEKETGIIYSNSPTQHVGCEVVSELEKVEHTHPMLSLAKTKSVDELVKVYDNKNCILSLKMDGLTICLTYDNGIITKAETRGNGHVGELVTHNVKVFENIPLKISEKGHYEIEGEAIITYDDFEFINQDLPPDKKYKNPRNLAAGSVRQLDSRVASQRHLKFIAWKVPTEDYSMVSGLKKAKNLGFTVVPYSYLWTSYPWTDCVNQLNHEELRNTFEQQIQELKNIADQYGYPIDGLVLTYDDIQYGKSLGMTGHHPRHSIAYKFYEDEEITRLRNIEWSVGKTGQLTPVAIYDPIELDGTTVNRASLHNVSILKDLKLGIGDEITVYKANAIIPQIRENLSRSGTVEIPSTCPVCNGQTEIQKENDSEVLVCQNPYCKAKTLSKLIHAVSRNALNIDGLSEATIEKFMERGWVQSIQNIYHLDNYKAEMENMDGFGKRSTSKLLASIYKSRTTTLDRFIYAQSIPLIGQSASKDIAKSCHYDLDEFRMRVDMEEEQVFRELTGFGEEMCKSIARWWQKERYEFCDLAQEFVFEKPVDKNSEVDLSGMTFVVTGSLEKFANRDSLKEELEALGAKVSGSVSAKTSYLVNNDINSNSSKNKKAKQLNVPIIDEDQLLQIMGR